MVPLRPQTQHPCGWLGESRAQRSKWACLCFTTLGCAVTSSKTAFWFQVAPCIQLSFVLKFSRLKKSENDRIPLPEDLIDNLPPRKTEVRRGKVLQAVKGRKQNDLTSPAPRPPEDPKSTLRSTSVSPPFLFTAFGPLYSSV